MSGRDARDADCLFAYTLRLGDNALVTGQRLGEWTGKAPELEEELAFGNFALDFIGQARAFYSYAASVEGRGRSEDDLAFLRDSHEFVNLLLVEQPNGDFAQTIARQFLFDVFAEAQLDALTGSRDETLAAIAARAVKELRYHVRHTRQWVLRLGDGTAESHERMQQAFDRLWQYTGELFDADDVDRRAAERGIGPLPDTLRPRWNDTVGETLRDATLERPADGWMASGGKRGRHSEHHGYLLAEMQFLQRAYPGATW